MAIIIPDDILQSAQVSDDELRLEIAIMLYSMNRLTIGQASEFCKLSQFEFQNILGERKIPINYDVNEFKRDLKTIDLIKDR